MKIRIVIVDVGYSTPSGDSHTVWAIPFESLRKAKEYAQKIKQYWEKKKINPGKRCRPITYSSVQVQKH